MSRKRTPYIEPPPNALKLDALRRNANARLLLLAVPDSTLRAHCLGVRPDLVTALRYQRALGLPLEGWLDPEERRTLSATPTKGKR